MLVLGNWCTVIMRFTAVTESGPPHIVGVAFLAVMIVLVVLLNVALVESALRPRILRSLGYGLGGIVGAYAIVRGIAEFFVVDFGDPASYRDDWGGPSLFDVFLVHSGPGLVVAILAVYLIRRRRAGRSLATG